MYCDSMSISSVVRSAFTNMKSICKNVRLCALKYGIGEGDVGCWRFSKEFFDQRFIYGMPRKIFAWKNFACDAIALREGLLWLGSYDSALSKEEFFPLLTLLRIIDAIDVAGFISIFIISFFLRCCACLYEFNNK